MEVPAASVGQPKGVPGAVVWIYVRVPPYLPAEDVAVDAGAVAVVDAGAVAVVDAGLAVVEASAVVVVGDAAGGSVCAAGVVGAGVVDGELQPIINEAHKTMRHKGTINLFILGPPLFELIF